MTNINIKMLPSVTINANKATTPKLNIKLRTNSPIFIPYNK